MSASHSFFFPTEKPDNHSLTKWDYECGVIDKDEVCRRFKNWKANNVFIGVVVEGSDVLSFFKGKKRGTESYVKSVVRKVVSSIVAFSKEEGNDWRFWKFITLTTKLEGKLSYDIMREGWNRLLTHLKYYARKQGRDIKVLRVFELQKRGSVHIHVILHGLRYIPKVKLGKMWGLGFVDIRVCRKIAQLVFYCTKYLKKSLTNDKITSMFWMWRARQWSMTFPIRLDFSRLSQKPPAKVYGVGAVWWWDGSSISFNVFIKNGYKGLIYNIEHEDYEYLAAQIASIIREIKQQHSKTQGFYA